MKKRIATILAAGLLYVIFLTAFSFIDSKVSAAEKSSVQSVHGQTSMDPFPEPPVPPPPPPPPPPQ